ncbi:LysR family transcriptional regulator [Vibrio sonorensis]|uniref:LysR family transcriptional regulator n=1 Tax=Vibrio sonorensis TaxID=1004316 RepID=UPI0008DAB912|nr:LysR family transcriptional regulator [Vibrio sonorensis]
MDKLSAMTTFVQTVDGGSFTSASKKLGISQQMVAKQVANLEQHLGVTLIQRTTRSHQLTAFGEVYYQRCKQILQDIKVAELLSHTLKNTPAGKLKVSAPRAFGAFSLTDFLTDFLERYPEIEVDVHLSDEYVDVQGGDFDAVFRVGKLEDSSLVARKLMDYKIICCASPDYLRRSGTPKSPDELIEHQCLGYLSEGSVNLNVWKFYREQETFKVMVNSRLKVNESRAMLAAVLNGFGIAMVPELMVARELAAGNLIQVLPEYEALSREFNLVYRQDPFQTATMSAFIEAVIARYR